VGREIRETWSSFLIDCAILIAGCGVFGGASLISGLADGLYYFLGTCFIALLICLTFYIFIRGRRVLIYVRCDELLFYGYPSFCHYRGKVLGVLKKGEILKANISSKYLASGEGMGMSTLMEIHVKGGGYSSCLLDRSSRLHEILAEPMDSSIVLVLMNGVGKYDKEFLMRWCAQAGQ